jgi:tetratricopeptide (TPR) repeat protein
VALTAYLHQDYELAKEHFTTANDMGRQMRYLEGSARALSGLATVALRQGNYADAERLFNEGLAHHRQMLNAGGMAAALMGLGNTALELGNFHAAAHYFEQALLSVQQTHAPRALLLLLVGIGRLFLLTGDERRGLDVLTVAAHHPAGDIQIRTEVQTVLARLPVTTMLEPPPASGNDNSDQSKDLWQSYSTMLVELSLRLRVLAAEPAQAQ